MINKRYNLKKFSKFFFDLEKKNINILKDFDFTKFIIDKVYYMLNTTG